MTPNMICTCPPIRSGSASAFAAVGHVDHVDASHHFEQFAGDVERAAGAAGRHVDFARIGLGIGDEFGNRIRRDRGINFHDQRNRTDAAYRRDVADEIERKVLVNRRVDGVRRHAEQECVAIRRRLDRRIRSRYCRRRLAGSPPRRAGRAAPTATGAIRRADDVGRAAGRNLNDEPHRPRRISPPP